MGLKLFHVCEKAELEVGKVPQLCYTLINTLGDQKFKLKNDLEQYANQANRLKVTFSAGGFFDINYRLTTTIFGSVFTYIIVLMQFQNI